MAPGLKIEINEEEFMGKTIKEQNLDLYKAVSYMNKHGCAYAKTQAKKKNIIAGISGAIFGFLAGIGKGFIE